MVKIRFYPLDITYRVKEGKTSVLLFGRAADGRRVCAVDSLFQPYFWVQLRKSQSLTDFQEAAERLSGSIKGSVLRVTSTELCKKSFLGEDVELVKVSVNHPAAVREFSSRVAGMPEVEQVLEADIQFVRRYLIDRGITPAALYEVEGEEVSVRSRSDIIIEMQAISKVSDDSMPEPKILAFDFETYNPSGKKVIPEEYPIVMASFYGEHGGAAFKKVIVWKKFRTAHEYVEFVDGEADLIARFKEVIGEYKPDIITGYYSDGFDLPYLHARAQKYGIELDLGMDYSPMREINEGSLSFEIKGIVHIDVLKFIKYFMAATLEVESFSLNSVAEELLGEKKADVDIAELAHVWDSLPEELDAYCEYNLVDSRLTFGLCSRILPNLFELAKVVPLPLFSLSRMRFSRLVEWYLLNQEKDFNVVSPNRPEREEMGRRMAQSFKGGFVYEPQPGLYDNIIIFDFRSLYPTVIGSHNISPESLNRECDEKEKDRAPVEGKDIWFCRARKSFISSVIENLIERRLRISEILSEKPDKMLEARAYTLKVLANAFYGYLGFYGSRWYSLECADAVTAWGRHYVKKVMSDAEKAGFSVLYSDTDSVFLALGNKKKEDAFKFAEQVNLNLPELMELEYEGFFPKGIFVPSKAAGHGAKKKYALLSEKGKLKIIGFEAVRRNWSAVARTVQREVLRLILKKGNAEAAVIHVCEVIGKLRKNRIGIDKVIITTRLQKEIESYDAVGPHVAVARQMKLRGIPVRKGTRISYVVVSGKGPIRDRARMPEDVTKKDYDHEYYIEHQLIPGVDSIFEVLGIDIRRIVAESAGKEQSSLDKFMGPND